MADKDQQSPHPLAPANGAYARSDAEAAATPDGAREQRKKNKRTKCLLYILLFAVFQTGIILLFALTVMKIRTPKFRVRSAAFENFNVGTPTNPSFNIRMNAEVGVKNTNFGRFKFESASMYFFYRGTQVAEVLVPKRRANWRSTKRFQVVVDMSMASSAQGNSQLASDLSAGVVPLTSQAKLRGNVRLMMVFKKNRGSDMNCSMEIVTATQQLQNIVCK
ncbi:hypothetical protein Pfo_014740 [Paulownia fortunei]|nr:hypothetical protein Pfo_014740 [Paulownia fortunei]